jgi:hypothetical protein
VGVVVGVVLHHNQRFEISNIPYTKAGAANNPAFALQIGVFTYYVRMR